MEPCTDYFSYFGSLNVVQVVPCITELSDDEQENRTEALTRTLTPER